jgi:hypothetical protein
MNCYVCAAQGTASPAVAICQSCSVGLCREHHDAERRTSGPGGTNYSCTHRQVAA